MNDLRLIVLAHGLRKQICLCDLRFDERCDRNRESAVVQSVLCDLMNSHSRFASGGSLSSEVGIKDLISS